MVLNVCKAYRPMAFKKHALISISFDFAVLNTTLLQLPLFLSMFLSYLWSFQLTGWWLSQQSCSEYKGKGLNISRDKNLDSSSIFEKCQGLVQWLSG